MSSASVRSVKLVYSKRFYYGMGNLLLSSNLTFLLIVFHYKPNFLMASVPKLH